MLATSLELAAKYDYLAAKFKVGYEFLRHGDLAALPVGKIPLQDGISVSVQEYTSKAPEDCLFETHDKYFDIQYVISGREAIGIVAREGLVIEKPYNPEKDIAYYKEPASSGAIVLNAGELVVLAPEDAHKPQLSVAGAPEQVKKIVIKIPV